MNSEHDEIRLERTATLERWQVRFDKLDRVLERVFRISVIAMAIFTILGLLVLEYELRTGKKIDKYGAKDRYKGVAR
jgi:hypothetical protein